MGAFLKDIDDYHEAEAATRSGVWGALGYALWTVISTVWEFVRTDLSAEFQFLTPTGKAVVIAYIAVPICVSLVAAWRFKLGKGLIAGALTLVVLVAQVGLAVANGQFMGILGYAIAFGILMSLINGIRGALALRNMPDSGAVAEAFE